jgi:hypothetical protein
VNSSPRLAILVIVALLLSFAFIPHAHVIAAPNDEDKASKPGEQKELPKAANETEEVFVDLIGCMGEVSATLKTVTDEASAKAAAPKFDRYRERLLKIKDRSVKANQGDMAVLEAATKKYATHLQAAMGDCKKEQDRIEKDEKVSRLMAEPLKKLEVFESVRVEEREAAEKK